MLTSFKAQRRLPILTINNIRDHLFEESDDISSTKLIYLGYLFAKGLYNDIVPFLEQMDQEESTLLVNTKHERFYYGTVMHVALFWNSGEMGILLFKLLLCYGSNLDVKNYYEEYPWEQFRGAWIEPLTNVILGNRSESEFEPMYTYIKNRYYDIQFELQDPIIEIEIEQVTTQEQFTTV